MLSKCQPWDGKIGSGLSDGYGYLYIKGRKVLAHRYVWEQANGPIPSGKIIMHLCNNRVCVNLEHLKLSTQSDNTVHSYASGKVHGNSKKTHCPKGHAYTPENTYIRPTGQRKCKQCNREGLRAYYTRKRHI